MPPSSAPGTVLSKLALNMKKSQPAPESVRCQKCLETGHWTYQCDKPQKYASRPSRTTELKKSVKQLEEDQKIAKLKELVPAKKRRKESSSSSGSDSSSSSDSDSSSSSSDSSESDSEKKLITKKKKRSKRNPSSSSGSTLDSTDMAQEADSEGE